MLLDKQVRKRWIFDLFFSTSPVRRTYRNELLTERSSMIRWRRRIGWDELGKRRGVA